MKAKDVLYSKYCKSIAGSVLGKKKIEKQLPDLTIFRKSIHVKGEPLSQVVIRGRG